MKDRQAELERNIVADSLAGFFKKVEPYSKLVLGVVVAIVVILLGLGLYNSERTAQRSDATLQLLMENPEVASQYPGTVAAAWSLLFQANDSLARGIDALYQDRDEAEALLSEAKDRFIDARAAGSDTLLISRANFGLGMAAESLGQIGEAVEAYERTVAANESSEMVEVAQERIDRLNKPATEEFLAWFAEQDFAPADPSMPPELPGASTLPDLPDLELPDLDLDLDDMSAEETDEATDPASDADAPAGGDAAKEAEPANEKEAEPADAAAPESDAPQADSDAASDAEPASEPETEPQP